MPDCLFDHFCQQMEEPTKFQFSYHVRQVAALLCVGTAAWEYCRAPEALEYFSIWILILHFVYFQLPMKSRVVAFFHAPSFIGAGVVPFSYLFLLYWKPNLETDHSNAWDMKLSTLVVRCAMIHFNPILFHSLDVTVNQTNLIAAYQMRPRNFMMLWALFSIPLLGAIHNFLFPPSEEFSGLNGITTYEFMWGSQIVASSAALVAFFLLYMLVLRRAFSLRRLRSRSFGASLTPLDP